MSLKNKSAAITTQSGWLDGECAVQVLIQSELFVILKVPS